MWGIIPAAGAGSRIQPLAFSKELLPVGSRVQDGVERPRAVSEYLIERMINAGATHICFVVSPGKSDILEYYGGQIGAADICYTVQPNPAGLCDAIFRALPVIPRGEHAVIGLPDTIWFPTNALQTLPMDTLAFLLFKVSQPQVFDAVVTDDDSRVIEIQVKSPFPSTDWVWGAFAMPQEKLCELYALWIERDRSDEYFGTLVNAYLERGGTAIGVKSGTSYVDVGTLNGYREAMKLLRQKRVRSNKDSGLPLTARQL